MVIIMNGSGQKVEAGENDESGTTEGEKSLTNRFRLSTECKRKRATKVGAARSHGKLFQVQ